ncbi:MAG: hypothetical protein ACREQW_03230 [Candidatus Binatia bacterium]
MKFTRELIISLLLVTAACGKPADNENQTQVTAKADARRPSSPSSSTTFEQRQKEDYETHLKALHDSYLKSIEDLKSEVQKGGAEVPKDLASTLGELEENTETINTILKKLDAASLESWQELKPDIHEALDYLEASYYQAVSQVNELEERQQAMNRSAARPKEVTSLKAEDR